MHKNNFSNVLGTRDLKKQFSFLKWLCWRYSSIVRGVLPTVDNGQYVPNWKRPTSTVMQNSSIWNCFSVTLAENQALSLI